MAKQVINLGTSANKGDGDPLRTAFDKVNNNFDEIYGLLGLNDNSLNLGAFEFTDSVMSTTDSTPIVIDQATTVTSNLTVGGDLLPSVANGSDLGSSARPWKSLYVSNQTIYLGGVPLGIDANGNLTVNGSLITGGGGGGSTLVNGSKTVSLGSDGNLTLPSQGKIMPANDVNSFLTFNYGDDVELKAGDNLYLSGGVATIRTNGNSNQWTFGTDGTLTLPDSATLAVGSEDEIIALTLVYTDYRDQLALVFDSANYTGDGYPASVDSYQQLTESVDPAIQPSWIVLAKAAFDAYEAVFIAQQAIDFKIDIYGREWRFTSDRTNITNSLTIPENTTITGIDNLELTVDGNGGKTAGIEFDAANNRVILKTTTKGWMFSNDGDLTLPAGGDILDSTGQSVLGSGAGTTQPYLELTDTPFITQPVTLGTPVTAIADLRGQDALVEVVIGEGPVIESITVTTPGVLYVVGQRYRINYWQVGGNSDNGNIDFEVATVGAGGALLTIANAAFAGPAQVNTGTYSNTSIEYRPTEFDIVGTGLTLTRGLYGGLFNAESEFSYNSSASPEGTLWNADGWGTLVGFNTRTYERFDLVLTGPDNTPPGELIMWDTINDKYYKFAINIWGTDNNEFSYTRTLITDPNYFKKANYATANDVDVIEDDSTLQIGITRGLNGGIYNPFTEEDWNSNVSPDGTLWNIDGWDDLTDVETRTYTNFYTTYDQQLGNLVPGSQAVMYVPSIEKYYAIGWLGWTQNNQGGGFSYTRREIDLTKLDQGVRFADGTVQTTAYTGTNVVSTAVGDRRIETASGYKQVSVTERVTNNYTGSTSQTTNGYELRIARTPELDAVIIPLNDGGLDAVYTLSFDGETYREVWLSSVQSTEYWFYYQVDNNQTTPQTEGDVVYLRIVTGADSQIWWNKTELPGGAGDFRGAVIDYHAYTGEATIIGTIHIVDDDGEEYITHTEVSSGSNDSMNDNLWIVTSEGSIRYARFDGEAKTLKIQWTAKVFYGSETND